MSSLPARPAMPCASAVADAELVGLRPVVVAVLSAVLRASKDHPDVEDATHETFRRALEGRARLREGEPLRPWVIGIARHVALDVHRSRRRIRVADERDTEAMESVVDPALAPDDQALEAQRKRRLREAMDELAEGPREALALFHIEGIGYQDIAARLDVPLGTVATWIARGRKAVAEAMQE